MYAVVVTDDSTPPNTPALIAAHVEIRKPSRIPTPEEMETSLRKMEEL